MAKFDLAGEAKKDPKWKAMTGPSKGADKDPDMDGDDDTDEMHDPDKYLDDAYAAAKRGDRKEFDAMVTAWKNC
jgi:hypothetical protein